MKHFLINMNTECDSVKSLTYKLQLENYYTFLILNDEGRNKSKKIENFLHTWASRTDADTAECHNMSCDWRADTPERVVFGGSWNYDQEMKILYQKACIYLYMYNHYVHSVCELSPKQRSKTTMRQCSGGPIETGAGTTC